MEEFLVTLGIILAVVSGIAFVVSIFMIFFRKTKPIALKIMIISVITFIIGFGTCLANFRLGSMH